MNVADIIRSMDNLELAQFLNEICSERDHVMSEKLEEQGIPHDLIEIPCLSIAHHLAFLFDWEYDNKPDQPDFYLIRLHCYVLGPGRHYEWKGRTLKNALDKAEKDINQWIRRDDNG